MAMIKLAFSLFLMAFARVTSGQDCRAVTVNSCLKAFDGFSGMIENNTIVFVDNLPYWNEDLDQLNDRCLRYQQFKGCIQTVKDHCDPIKRSFFYGIISAYDFLCTDSENSLQDFMKYQSCFTNQKVHNRAMFCQENYANKLETLKGEIGVRQTELYCIYTDVYLDCISTTVDSICKDDDATQWQKTWNRKLRQPLMHDVYNCPGWDDSNGQAVTVWTIVLSVVLGLTALIMVIGIVAILIFVNRKKKSRRRAAIPPPPPYTADPTIIVLPTNDTAQGAAGGTSFPSAQPKRVAGLPPYAGSKAPSYDGSDKESEAPQRVERGAVVAEEGGGDVLRGASSGATTKDTGGRNSSEIDADWF